MRASAFQGSWGRVAIGVIYLLLTFAAVGLLCETVQPPHVHASDTPGFYDPECPLALIAHQTEASLPDAPPPVWTALAVGIAVVVEVPSVPVRPALHTDSRAPPLV
jgi:hypothetical protein